jgi:tetratricopeptide (TPR) repeat protein
MVGIMSKDDSSSKASGSDSDSGELLEELIAHYVDRLTEGVLLDPDAIRLRHPEIADRLLENLEAFIEAGPGGPGPGGHGRQPLGTLGDYTLRRQIGRGGMGVVYEAWENSMDRRVALKVLPPGVAADERALQRFVREAKTAGQLNHSNVVGVYSTGVREGTPWYAMEFVQGETLAQILVKVKETASETETPFGPKDQVDYFAMLARCFADVADGLQHAHSKGVIHRDIKPSNLILDGEGRLRILDFGLARLEGQESLTLTGDFVGTPLYMSPEQARRKKIPVDHRTDIYSLGATLYEMLALRPPFQGKDHQDTLSQIIQRDPVELRRINLRVPVDIETICLKCLRKDPNDRYGTAEAMAQDLRRFARNDPIEARPEGRWGRAVRFVRAGRIALSLAGLGLAVVVLLAVVVASSLTEASRSTLLRYETLVAEGRRTLDLAFATRVQQTIQEQQTSVFFERSSPFTGDLPRRRMGQLLERAEAGLRQAVALFPARPEARAQLERVARLRDAPLLAAEEADPGTVERGVAHLLAGRLDPARLELAIARGSFPDSPAPVLLVAQSYALGGDEDAADAWLERCFQERTLATRDDLAMNIAEFWFMQRRGRGTPSSRSAIAGRIERWLERVPDSLEKRQALLISQAWTDPRRALDAGQRALELAPDDPVTHSQLAVLYSWDLADQARAEQHARMALELGGDDSGVLTAVGQVWYELGRHHEAIAVAEAALALEPGNARPLFVIGMSRVMLGECAEAEKVYRQVLERHPGDDLALGYLSGALGCQGKHEEGLEFAQQAIRSAPAEPGPYTHLGNRYLQMGRFDEAAQAYDRVLEIDPENRWAMWGLAYACLQRGDFDKSLALLCDAIPRAASPVHTSSGARWNFAELLRGIPRPKDLSPLDGFLERCEAKPEESDPPAIVLEDLALAYLHAPHRRNIERSLALAEKAVEATRWQNVGAVVTLASVHFAAGAIGEAIRLLENHVDVSRLGEHREFIESCRRAFLPDFASFASVDALFADVPVDMDLLGAAFADLDALEPTPDRLATIAYFRARLSERDGRCEDGAAAFAAAFKAGNENLRWQVPNTGPCIEASPALREAVVAACQAALAAPSGEGTVARALAGLEALGSQGDEIPALGAVHIWWILGPLEGSGELSTDAIDPSSVDLQAPLVHNGKLLRWQRHVLAASKIDLAAIFGSLGNASALLYSEIHVAANIDVDAILHVDDQVVVSLNSSEVYRFEGANSPGREHVVRATCKAGVNRLLLRIRNLYGPWSVALRLEEKGGLPLRFRQGL